MCLYLYKRRFGLDKKEVKKKIKAIILWYELSSELLDDGKKLDLLSLWKNICVEFEEYEVASILRKKRSLLLREIRYKNNKGRTSIKTLLLRIKIYKRWVKRLF